MAEQNVPAQGSQGFKGQQTQLSDIDYKDVS